MAIHQERKMFSQTGSERATVGSGNKIITRNGKRHVVWQDISRDGYLNRVRSCDLASGEWTGPVTLNAGVDNHARPVVASDYDGYLHVILGGHNSPVTYRRSVRPDDSTEWTEEIEAGSGTYPVIVCGADNTLYLTLRTSGLHGVDLYSKPVGKPWQKVTQLIVRTEEYVKGYAGYHNSLAVDPYGVLHYVGDFYEGKGFHEERGIHQAVCYMRSRDGGITWEKGDGSAVSVPARPEQMDILARSLRPRHEQYPPPEVRNGGIAVDSRGHIYVAYSSHSEMPGQIILSTLREDGSWEQRDIAVQLDVASEMRAIGCQLSMLDDDTICIATTLAPLGDGWIDNKPSRALGFSETTDKQLVCLVSRDHGQTFQTHRLIEQGNVFNGPNMERPVGSNGIPAGSLPPYIYFDGSRDYPGGMHNYFKNIKNYIEQGELLTNNVFVVEVQLR